MEWLLNDLYQIWLNRESWVLYGGMIVVGMTMALMGTLKLVFGNKIQNKLLRKTILSFVSVILIAPLTALYLCLNQPNGIAYFWYVYAANCVFTIVVYWFYENTHIRELLSLVGKNTIYRAWSAIVNKNADPKETVKQIQADAKKIVSKSKYDEDDLKNL